MKLRNSETKRQYHDRRLQELKAQRNPWEAHWADLAAHVAPARYRPTILDKDDGWPDRRKIVDGTGGMALRTLASGMHSGITSPARPWFRLTTFDPDLREVPGVRAYLSKVQTLMAEVYQGSNLYTAFHSGYFDLGLFGQSCGLLVEDDNTTVRIMPSIHGSFYIARDPGGVATTLYRQFSWSVERIVSRFGTDNLPTTIRNAYDKGDYDRRFTVNHAVEPRMERQVGKIDRANKPFLSNYWADGLDRFNESGLLEESGFDENPIIAPPWELVAEDHYAISPGQDTLPDIKMLQVEQMRKGEAIDKMVRPPMTGPTSMRNNPASLMPGSVTYVDDPSGKGYRPAMEVNLRIGELQQDIREVQNRIERGFYADLFLMLANMEGIQPRNVMEIAERKEEKLLALGPVLENIYGGQLAPTIDRTYAIMDRRGMLPPPPPELEGQPIKIEYISMLAQAQKAVATGSVERIASFVGSLAAVKPEVLDKLDADQAVDVYSDMVGAPPEIIVSDDNVAGVRQQRAQAAAQAAQAEQAATLAPAARQGAEAARILSETPSGNTQGGGQNLLRQLGLA